VKSSGGIRLSLIGCPVYATVDFGKNAAASLYETATPAPAPVTPAPVSTPTEVQKAAAAGAEAAEVLARTIVINTVKEAQLAADLLHKFANISKAAQQKVAAQLKKAEGGPPMPPPGPGGAGMPIPDGNAGPEMPPPAPPGMGGGGGGMPLGLGGGGGGGGPAPTDNGGDEGGAPPIDPSKLTPEQIEQILTALMETQGHADPKAMEESGDPAMAQMGKQARAFLKSGKFEIGKPKTAAQRKAIDNMKQFLLETSR
jgi:hypothetical protein